MSGYFDLWGDYIPKITLKELPEMFDDPREVVAIDDVAACINHYRVGVKGVTKLVVYKEHGSLDFIPYIAAYVDEMLVTRMPAIGMTIHYKG